MSNLFIPTYECGVNIPADTLRAYPVEGFRERWREQLLTNYPRPRMPGVNRAHYLGALHVLKAQFQPWGFERSTPVARFQFQLEAVVRMMEQAVPFDTLNGQRGYRVVASAAEIQDLCKRHHAPDLGGVIIKQLPTDDGPDELYCYIGGAGLDPGNTWAFRVL